LSPHGESPLAPTSDLPVTQPTHAAASRHNRPSGRVGQIAFLAGLAAVAALAVIWLLWAALSQARAPVRAGLLGYRVVDDAVELRIEVVKDPAVRAVCLVRARDGTGYEVGRAELAVPAGEPRRRVVTYRLETNGRPVGGELRGCRPADTN
jgi:Domain of unknown function (DUF4307)